MTFIDQMKGQDYIDKTREYLNYLEEHLKNVQFAFTELSNACQDMAWVTDDFTWNTVRQQVIDHDLSKFSKEEFIQYRDSFFPVCKEDKENSGFDAAWENHKQNNHHHHETAESYIDIIHMIIDWTAMGYKFGDTAQQFFEKNKDKIILSETNRILMYKIFERIERHNKTNS